MVVNVKVQQQLQYTYIQLIICSKYDFYKSMLKIVILKLRYKLSFFNFVSIKYN